MAQFQAVNNDSVTSVPGDIVKNSGQSYGVLPAIASTGNLALLGVWQTATTVGGSGVVKDDLVEVNCAVTVAIGDKLYLSADTAGKATNVAPANPYFVGVVVSARVVSTVQKATINFVHSTVGSDIAVATSNTPGVMTAAQNNQLAAYAPPGWGDLQRQRMVARLSGSPVINNFWAMPVTLLSLTNSTPVNVDGGGITMPNYASTSWWYGTQSLLATPQATRWGLAFRAKWNGGAGSRTSMLGINDGTTWAMLAFYPAQQAYGLWAGSGGSSTASGTATDANWHDVMITCDATNLYLDVDGVLIQTMSGLTHIPASSGRMAGGTNGGTSDLTITDAAFGCVR